MSPTPSRARRLRFLLVIAALALGSLVTVTDASARRPLGENPDRDFLVHDGLRRSYVVRVPDSVRASRKPVPFVIVLHGGGGNAAITERMTGFTAKAAREGFIVVYPEGTGRREGILLTWNAGHCCGYAMDHDVDDVGFVRSLIDTLSRRYPIDPKRIYATGMSNGAMMAHTLGIGLSDRLAAIAPVVGAVFGDEPLPASPVSALMINGALDHHIALAGGPPSGPFARAWDGTPTRPAAEQALFWARADNCGPAAQAAEHAPVAHWVQRCPHGRAVERYVLADNGHAWPGGEAGSRRGDVPSTAIDATDVIWRFFADHPNPP